MLRIMLTTTICLVVNFLAAQSDSLLQELDKADDDHVLEVMDQICIQATDTGVMNQWSKRLIDRAIELEDPFYEAMGHHHLGRFYGTVGEIPKSVIQHRMAIKLFSSIDRIDKVARQYINLGNRYADIGQYDSALSIYERSQHYALLAKDTTALYGSLLNISTIHHDRGDYAKELEYMMLARDLIEKMGSEYEKAITNYNMAVYYAENKAVDKALEMADLAYKGYTKTDNFYGLGSVHMLLSQVAAINRDFEKATIELDSSIVFYQKSGDVSRVGLALLNQGELLMEIGKESLALEKFNTALRIFKEIGDKRYEAKTIMQKVDYWFKNGSNEKAIELANEAIRIGEEIYVRSDLIMWYADLAMLYSKSGQGQQAYEALAKVMVLKDSAHAENKETAIADAEAMFQNEKKQLDIERLTREKQTQENALLLERSKRNWILIGLTLAIIMVLIVGYALIQKRKDNQLISKQKNEVESQNELISRQKLLVEEKNKEITDSINYAQRIQEAILPEQSAWFNALPNSMVLYMPKDIVAGDFYWLEETDNATYFAAADCTGHGVPGAMVSVVCHNALNRAIREYHMTDTGQILDKVRELVVETFLAQSKDTIKDGMDIALCSIEKSEAQGDLRKVQFSGAHNPLWIVSNANYDLPVKLERDGVALHEVKGDKQPVGKFEAQTPFTSHDLQLKKGDKLYLFSDGYADQFGGSRGKKLKPSAMRDKVLEIHSLSFGEQRDGLKQHIDQWRGDLEQIDDICIIGVEV